MIYDAILYKTEDGKRSLFRSKDFFMIDGQGFVNSFLYSLNSVGATFSQEDNKTGKCYEFTLRQGVDEVGFLVLRYT